VAASTDDPAEFLLTGTKSYVIDGHTASVLLVLADGPAGPTLFVVDGDGSGVERTRLSTMDQTRKQASVRFDGACGRVVGEPGGGAQALERGLDHALVALAAECVGGARQCLEQATDYAKVRHQFGRPIGSFQAIKHKCAEVLVDVELAQATATYAAGRDADSDPRLG